MEEVSTKVVYIDPILRELIPGFLQNRWREIDEMKYLIENSQYKQIEIYGHSMKGYGAGYGFTDISHIGKCLEEAASNENRDEIVRLLHKLSTYLDEADIRYK